MKYFRETRLGASTYQYYLLPQNRPVAWVEDGQSYVHEGFIETLNDEQLLELMQITSVRMNQFKSKE